MYLYASMSFDSILIRTYASDEEYSPLTPPASPVAATEQPPTLPPPTVDSESEPEEEYPVPLSLTLPPPTSSPEPKRRRLEPTDDSTMYEEIMHIQSSSSSRECEWLSDTIRSRVREDRVPPPITYLTDPATSTLPPLRYPLEHAFDAFMAKMDRELRNMREAAGEITRIIDSQERMKDRTEEVVESLEETDDCHNRLVDKVSELRAHVIELTTRVNATEARAAAAEATAN